MTLFVHSLLLSNLRVLVDLCEMSAVLVGIAPLSRSVTRLLATLLLQRFLFGCDSALMHFGCLASLVQLELKNGE